MIIGLVGFIGSGKGTVADLLVSNHGFIKESFANSDDDKAYQDLHYMIKTLSGGGGMGEKRSQATAPIVKVTMETKLMKDSTDLLTDYKKLSGI